MEELKYINDPEVQKFIQEHRADNVSELALKARRYVDLPMGFIIDQIHALQKVKTKLPLFFESKDLIYPPKLNLEQSSSELTAKYKATLLHGDIIDLTGGFGVDSFFFAKEVKSVVHCERNEYLSRVVQHNFSVLGVGNVSFEFGDSLESVNRNFDGVYIDPARRSDMNQKVFRFVDCEPNLPSIQERLFEYSKTILVKASPLIDLKQGLSELDFVKEIHVVSVGNECKEVLFLQEKGFQEDVRICCVELQRDYDDFEFSFEEERNVTLNLGEPMTYLYEAGSSINKAGAFNSVADQFGLSKLHPNSHLYTSKDVIEDFPGRIFKIEHVLPYSKKELQRLLPDRKANVTARNFKVSVSDIRKKLGLKEGGDKYLFATTSTNNKPLIVLCTRY